MASLLSAILVFGAFDEVTPTQAQSTSTATVTAFFLNVRSGPGIQHSRIGFLVGGQVVTLVGRDASGAWVQAQLSSGNTGWISARWIRSNNVIFSLPVTDGAQAAVRLHVVQPGENLFRIALRYGVSLPALAVANGITNVNHIHIGQVLRIP